MYVKRNFLIMLCRRINRICLKRLFRSRSILKSDLFRFSCNCSTVSFLGYQSWTRGRTSFTDLTASRRTWYSAPSSRSVRDPDLEESRWWIRSNTVRGPSACPERPVATSSPQCYQRGHEPAPPPPPHSLMDHPTTVRVFFSVGPRQETALFRSDTPAEQIKGNLHLHRRFDESIFVVYCSGERRNPPIIKASPTTP